MGRIGKATAARRPARKGTAPVGAYDGYDVLLIEIVKMFRGGPPPVTPEETLELYAFMKAAEVSQQRGGAEVTLGGSPDRGAQGRWPITARRC